MWQRQVRSFVALRQDTGPHKVCRSATTKAEKQCLALSCGTTQEESFRRERAPANDGRTIEATEQTEQPWHLEELERDDKRIRVDAPTVFLLTVLRGSKLAKPTGRK